MTKRVLLPQKIEPEAVRLLEQHGCVIIAAADPKIETVMPLMKDADGIILRTGIVMSAPLLASAGKLQIIARTGGGVDNVDLAAATQRGIIVTSNLGVNTISVVEHALALMLALSKRLRDLDRAVRQDNFQIRYQNLPGDLHGKTLGLIGFGRIGSELARVCRELFAMQIMAFDPYLPDSVKSKHNGKVSFVELADLLAGADVISIHVPLTDSTRNLLDLPRLKSMKPGAILINTSRGGIVDETALAQVLKADHLTGAGLDVFASEPVSMDHPLLKLDNVILTPHSAALTRECVVRMAVEAARCVLAVFSGRRPPNVANEAVLNQARWNHMTPEGMLSDTVIAKS
jgi:D-3-phosphoglycerate dehydrogenase / 2-oxoglutarate reductase